MFFLIGCGNTKLPPAEYIRYIEDADNGLKKDKTVNDFSFRLQYKPSEYIVLRESKADNLPDEKKFSSRKAELDSFYFFNLDIYSSDKKTSVLSYKIKNDEEYYSRMNYFISHAQADIKLVTDADTLPCALYHFERTYDLSPYNTIVLGFKKSALSTRNLYFIFDEKTLGAGQINFEIDKNKIKNIPQLKL